MRAWFLRVFTFAALPLTLVASQPAGTGAPRPVTRGLAVAVEPVIQTSIEALLAMPNVLLVTNYYRIDMRFGPSMRLDAVVVEAADSRTRLKGIRASFMDIDELTKLSRGLTSMAALAEKWTGHDDRHATELSFTSAGGFRLAIRQSARIPRAFLSTGLIDPVVTSIEIAELTTL
jgi:hypothetical protein